MVAENRMAASQPDPIVHVDATPYFPQTPILNSAETARLMGFRSKEALARVRLAGRLPIQMFQVPGRRGWFAATDQVKAWVEEVLGTNGSSAPLGRASRATMLHNR